VGNLKLTFGNSKLVNSRNKNPLVVRRITTEIGVGGSENFLFVFSIKIGYVGPHIYFYLLGIKIGNAWYMPDNSSKNSDTHS
jgi:hypothetical protein